jgi:pentatricopeptide repeat protein
MHFSSNVGLRMMLREKIARGRQQNRNSVNKNIENQQKTKPLANEVGAWTAAIDACAKADRLDTATRLFYSMPKFDVKPNVYTCGALMDGLLKSNSENYLDETLNVLKYMKEEGIAPSEVMYTSLITSASKIAKKENAERGEIVLRSFGDRVAAPDSNNSSEGLDRMKALDVYTELILSLTSHGTSTNMPPQKKVSDQSKNSNIETSDEVLVKVFLVLQEMKAHGAAPDIACYNAILKACAKAGDVVKLKDVLRRIELDGLRPNSKTWNQILRCASIARDSTMAESMWKMALSEQEDHHDDSFSSSKWVPHADEFDSLISSYIRESAKDPDAKSRLYSKVIDAYISVANKEEEEFGFINIDVESIMEKPRVVKMVSQAATFFKNNQDLALDIPLMPANIRQI